jgi:hypothetical protein
MSSSAGTPPEPGRQKNLQKTDLKDESLTFFSLSVLTIKSPLLGPMFASCLQAEKWPFSAATNLIQPSTEKECRRSAPITPQQLRWDILFSNPDWHPFANPGSLFA